MRNTYSEIVGGTVFVATGLGLIGAILTVDRRVAVPVFGYTDARGLAAELFVRALVGVQRWAAQLK